VPLVTLEIAVSLILAHPITTKILGIFPDEKCDVLSLERNITECCTKHIWSKSIADIFLFHTESLSS
jgi:hypothetical protein